MNREAASRQPCGFDLQRADGSRGTSCWRAGAGRLRCLTDPARGEIERTPPGKGGSRRNKRDPRDPTGVALPLGTTELELETRNSKLD